MLVPSLSSLDLARLNMELGRIQNAGAQRLHVDVCDGHFAPGITVGQPVVESLIKSAKLEIEAHLLVERPERFVKDFIEIGVSRIAIHPEATRRLLPTLEKIQAKGCKAGVVLNSETPVDSLIPALREVDFIILLCDETKAAFGGEQASKANMAATAEKLQSLVELRKKSGLDFSIAVECRLTREQAAQLEAAGADILIAAGASKWSAGTSGMLVTHSVEAAGRTGGKIPTGQPPENY